MLKFRHFVDLCYDNKKYSKEDEPKIARQENGDENTMLMVIDAKTSCSRIQASCSQIQKTCIRLPTKENVLVISR